MESTTPTPTGTVTFTLTVEEAAAVWETGLQAVLAGGSAQVLCDGLDGIEEALDASGLAWDPTSFNAAIAR